VPNGLNGWRTKDLVEASAIVKEDQMVGRDLVARTALVAAQQDPSMSSGRP